MTDDQFLEEPEESMEEDMMDEQGEDEIEELESNSELNTLRTDESKAISKTKKIKKFNNISEETSKAKLFFAQKDQGIQRIMTKQISNNGGVDALRYQYCQDEQIQKINQQIQKIEQKTSKFYEENN